MLMQDYPLRHETRNRRKAACRGAMRPRLFSIAATAKWLGTAVAIALFAVPALAPAQTGSAAAGSGAQSGAPQVELSPVNAYRLALLEMRGHLSVARELVQLGLPGAKYHMGPALEQIYQRIADPLAKRDAPLSEGTLRELKNASSLERTRALPAIESAVNAINGSFAQTGALDAKSVLALVGGLLRNAVADYDAAVSNNDEVNNLQKYQTGRGLVTQAEALVRHSGALASQPGQADLLNVVVLIRQSWPGVMPPPIVFDPRLVRQRLDQAEAIMKKMK